MIVHIENSLCVLHGCCNAVEWMRVGNNPPLGIRADGSVHRRHQRVPPREAAEDLDRSSELLQRGVHRPRNRRTSERQRRAAECVAGPRGLRVDRALWQPGGVDVGPGRGRLQKPVQQLGTGWTGQQELRWDLRGDENIGALDGPLL